MESELYQPKYHANDYDWIGYDGVGAVGWIRKEMHVPTEGKWQWAGWCPRKLGGAPPAPNTGFVETAQIATQRCAEYRDRCKDDAAKDILIDVK